MRIFSPILLFCCLVACQNRPATPDTPAGPSIRDQISRTWLLTDYKVQRRSAPGAATAERQKEKLLAARVLFHFFPDGQWAFIEGEQYYAGHWTLDERDHKIRCSYDTPDSAQLLFFKIRRLTPDTLIADLSHNQQTLSATLESDGYAYDSPEKCPWHPDNNEWRRKPDHAETEPEIKARAINHLRHYYRLLDAALSNSPHTVTVKNSPSCIQIYNSGIGIRSAENIDAAWYATFYDRRDAGKCLQLYGKMMGAEGILTGPKTHNWISDDLTLLQRLMNRLQDEE